MYSCLALKKLNITTEYSRDYIEYNVDLDVKHKINKIYPCRAPIENLELIGFCNEIDLKIGVLKIVPQLKKLKTLSFSKIPEKHITQIL